jgi:hypothetical protein
MNDAVEFDLEKLTLECLNKLLDDPWLSFFMPNDSKDIIREKFISDMKLCPRCKGAMRIPDPEWKEGDNDDGKMPCPHCEGEGTIEEEEK